MTRSAAPAAVPGIGLPDARGRARDSRYFRRRVGPPNATVAPPASRKITSPCPDNPANCDRQMPFTPPGNNELELKLALAPPPHRTGGT